MEVSNDICLSLDNGLAPAIFLLDICLIFVTDNHSITLEKCEHLNQQKAGLNVI